MDIVSVLRSKPHNTHYLNRYISFVERCQLKNEKILEGYYEKHHICPKAKDAFPEYKDFRKFPQNCILLTAKQHFIAHMILWKAYPQLRSVRETFWIMSNIENRKIRSRFYEILKQEKSVSTSICHTGKIVSKITREKLSVYRKGKTYNEIMGEEKASELKQRQSAQRKGKYTGKDNPMFGKKHSEERNLKLSVSFKGIGNPMFGKTHTGEARNKISKARKEQAEKRKERAENFSINVKK